MKKILALILALSMPPMAMERASISARIFFIAIGGMAYLYFNELKADQKNSDSSLLAAAANSALLLSFENDKSILDILSSQKLFSEISGEEKFSEMESLKRYLLSAPNINKAIDKQAIYISIIPDGDKISFLYTTQLNPNFTTDQLTKALATNGISAFSSNNLTQIRLPDSTTFYLGIKENVILFCRQQTAVLNALNTPLKSSSFTDYIKSGSRVKKNSLAELYINFEKLSPLLKATMSRKLTNELSYLNGLPAYASLTYSFSKEKMFMTGTTALMKEGSYQQLFDKSTPQKLTVSNIFPEKTANYTIYAIDNYEDWSKSLQGWFKSQKLEELRRNAITAYNQKYRLALDEIFPKYAQNQFAIFQLNTSEKVAAISLKNGAKVEQLLIDLSEDYSADIKSFREDNLLFYYFGEPFKAFRRPYYTIIDNNIIIANNSSTLDSFLNSYKSNHLLINDQDYVNAIDQLTNTANISYYVNLKNSTDIFRKNLYLPYYKQLRAENGMKAYTSFIYQLSGENGKFQTNLLLTKKSDSLKNLPESDN